MKKLFVRFIRDEEGQDLIEDPLLASLISIVCIVSGDDRSQYQHSLRDDRHGAPALRRERPRSVRGHADGGSRRAPSSGRWSWTGEHCDAIDCVGGLVSGASADTCFSTTTRRT